MKYCWSSSDSQKPIITPIIIVCIVMCIPEIVQLLSDDHANNGRTVSVVIMLLLAILFPGWFAFVGSRTYAINEKGMTIQYPFGITRIYRWEEFSEIALCKVHHSAGRNTHILAIRCVTDEEYGPGQANTSRERWATREYELFHFRKVISIYFNSHRYTEFVNICPCPIRDYRNLPEWK